MAGTLTALQLQVETGLDMVIADEVGIVAKILKDMGKIEDR